MTGQDPNNHPGNLVPAHPTDPSDQTTISHTSGNSQNQVNHQTSNLSSSSPSGSCSSDSLRGPELTPTPSPTHSAGQSSSDFDSSSTEDQRDNERHVRFRSYESIQYFERDVPINNPPLYPHTHRRKKRFRKKPFPPDTDISCGRSIFETREDDAMREFHSGNHGRAEAYFFWDDMLHEQRFITLKRSNTVPESTSRISSLTHGNMMVRNVMDGGGGRHSSFIRPFQPSPELFNFDFENFRIYHHRPEMSRLNVEDWLTHAAGLGPLWGDTEPLALNFHSTGSMHSALSDPAAESTSSNDAGLPSASTPDSTSFNATTQINSTPTSFSQGYSTSNANTSFTSASSSPMSSRPKHKRRSAPATSNSTCYPRQTQFYQLSAVATHSSINIHFAEDSSAHYQEDNGAGVGQGSGSSRWKPLLSPPSQPTFSPSSLQPSSTISSSHSPANPTLTQTIHSNTSPTPVPQATPSGSIFRYPSHQPIMSRQLQTAPNSSPTEAFSCSSPQRQREMEQEQQQARRQQGRRHTNAQVISLFPAPPQYLSQNTSSLTVSPCRHSAPASAALSGPHPSRNSAPVRPFRPAFETISRQRMSLATPPPETNETKSTLIRNSTSSSSSGSDSKIKNGTAGGATLENSTTLLSSGPPQSSWLTNPSLEDLSLPALKYRIPRPATVSPILQAVMFAASQGLANNNSPGRVENDVPVLNLASQPFPAVLRNAAWEVNTRGSSSYLSPSHRTRTAAENEEIRRGKQTDRSIRDNQLQNIQKQVLQNDQIQEILDDYYIDEEQVIDEDEYYDVDREAKGECKLAEGDDDTQVLINDGKSKKNKKKTLLQRVKSAFTKKSKKSPEAG
ncbi:hypothetical protein BGZ91_001296 [Linnemannia elongata]|nr:hypothetical protein BGZ91_001296 [Linnemannia elongata]KAG0074373.1 hypothetical protein BGZ90_010820 [Linnemannia elongata]